MQTRVNYFMNKETLLSELEKGLEWEDEFVANYESGATFELLKTLEKGKFDGIWKLLKENIDDSRRHASMIKDIIEKIRSGEYYV